MESKTKYIKYLTSKQRFPQVKSKMFPPVYNILLVWLAFLNVHFIASYTLSSAHLSHGLYFARVNSYFFVVSLILRLAIV